MTQVRGAVVSQATALTCVADDVAVRYCAVVTVQQVQAALPGRRVEVLSPDLALFHTDAGVQTAHDAVRRRTYLTCNVHTHGRQGSR